MTHTDKEAERRRMATAIMAGFACSPSARAYAEETNVAKDAVKWATALQEELDRTAANPPAKCAHLRRHIAADSRLPAQAFDELAETLRKAFALDEQPAPPSENGPSSSDR